MVLFSVDCTMIVFMGLVFMVVCEGTSEGTNGGTSGGTSGPENRVITG